MSSFRPYLYLKRAIDIAVSALGLLCALPILVVVALAIWATLGKPLFFCHQRIGQGGKSFTFIKFRTMRDLRDEAGNLLPDEQRMTRFGKKLRATSIDELPSLMHVLFGQMSLIGPRPLLPEYVPYYSEEQMRRHELRPGITGLAQVNGRNAVQWEDRFRYDVEYVDTVSLKRDIEILWRTVMVVFKRQGIHADGHVTMPRFDDYMKNKS